MENNYIKLNNFIDISDIIIDKMGNQQLKILW